MSKRCPFDGAITLAVVSGTIRSFFDWPIVIFLAGLSQASCGWKGIFSLRPMLTTSVLPNPLS